jgi:hypothetical protein
MNTKEIKQLARAIARALAAEGYPKTIKDATSKRGERGLHGVLLHAISSALGERNFHQASAKEEAARPTEPTEVWLATYQHRHGEDHRAFSSRELALEWRTQIAKEWWEQEVGDDEEVPSDEDIGEIYFEELREREPGEFFDIEQMPLETQSALVNLNTPSGK